MTKIPTGFLTDHPTLRSEEEAAFDAWLRATPNARRAIAESNHPDLVHAAMRLAFSCGVIHGYRDGVRVGIDLDLGRL